MWSRTRIAVIAMLLSGMALCGYGLVALNWKSPAVTKSPALISNTQYAGPGSGHAFGFDVEYIVTKHVIHNGITTAVVTSSAKGEENVEIWSPIPDLVALPDGSTFKLAESDSWNTSFKLLRRGG